MKGKLETKMARLAFGDVDPQEALRLHAEAKSDPKAAQMLAEYESMRKGLQALREVPSDQLSSDRMREAILRDGLKPVSPARGWGWAPVAVAAMAFAFFAMRQATPVSGTELRVAQSEIPRLLPESRLGLMAEVRKDAKLPTVAKVVPAAPVVPTVAHLVKQHRSHHAAPDEGIAFNLDPSTLMVNANAFNMPSPTPVNGMLRNSEPTNRVLVASVADAQTNSASPSAPPIVMIDQETDRDTGAQRAIEVENSTNVVIGG